MRIRRLPVVGRIGQNLKLIILAGLGVSMLAIGAGGFTASEPAFDPIQDSMWKKRIRRLKLADPESTEEMLARAGTVRIVSRAG